MSSFNIRTLSSGSVYFLRPYINCFTSFISWVDDDLRECFEARKDKGLSSCTLVVTSLILLSNSWLEGLYCYLLFIVIADSLFWAFDLVLGLDLNRSDCNSLNWLCLSSVDTLFKNSPCAPIDFLRDVVGLLGIYNFVVVVRSGCKREDNYRWFWVGVWFSVYLVV